MRCYLIDDDLDDQEFFAVALQEVDTFCKLETSSSGVDALEELSNAEVAPDVIFLDLNMPRIDGWECLNRLKAIKHLKATPVVIYSTSEPSQDFLASKNFDFFLTKQPKISDLVVKIKDILSRIRAGNYVDSGR